MADFFEVIVDGVKVDIPIVRRSLNEGFLYGEEPHSFGCVERDFAVDPIEMRDSPTSMQVYDDKQAKELYDEQMAKESSLLHMFLRGGKPAFQFLDQDGFPDCHTADTEVLTSRGFVSWPDYNWTDPLGTVNQSTHALEYQLPFQKIIKEYNGPIVHSSNRRVDFAVTPNHGMYVRKWNERERTLSNAYSFVRAGDLGWYVGMLHAPSGHRGTEIIEVEVPGDRRYDGDDFFAMLGLITSDGFAGGTEKTRNLVSFASFREDIRPNIAALAARLGFKEAPSRPGVWNRWGAGALADWIRANCYTNPALKARNKRAPELVKCASSRQIKHFLHYFDDRRRDGVFYYSSSKKLIDDLQELHLKIGMRSVVVPNHTPQREWNGKTFIASDGYRLIVSSGDQLCLDKKKHISQDHYKGEVYCAAVPNHTLVTRRNGTVLISSNCWYHGPAHAFMFACMRDNEPIPRINAVAGATLLNRTDGGWSGLAAKDLRDNGAPLMGDGEGEWPQWTRAKKYNTAAFQANRVKHKVLEDWYDMSSEVYDQELTRQQIVTCGLNHSPMSGDWNKFGHAMGIPYVAHIDGRFHPININSWKQYGRFGLSVLYDLWPNNCVSIRTTTSGA